MAGRTAARAILDPDLPMIDPHHHLWERPNHRYLLDDFLADVRAGSIVWTLLGQKLPAPSEPPGH